MKTELEKAQILIKAENEKKMLVFKTEYEALCKKHGFEIQQER